MRNDPRIADPVLTEHVNRIIDEEARRAGVSVEAVLNGCKRIGDVRAREAIVHRLRSTVEMRSSFVTMPNKRAERQFGYRIRSDDGEVHDQWQPLSTTKIAHLLGLDHSTVVYILRRLNGRGQ